MTVASTALALLLAQRAFNVPPPAVRLQDDPAFATSAAATPPQPAPQQAGQDPASAGSAAAASAPPGTGNDGETLRRAQGEIQALRGQVAAIQQELSDTRTRLAAESARAQGLEQQVAALQQAQAQQETVRQQAADESASARQQRAADTALATQGLAGAQQALTQGNASGVDAALVDELQRLEQARGLAAKQGSDQEALRADTAARWIQTARDALARGDLAQARAAVAQAQAQAGAASALSGQAAGTGSGSPAPAAGGTGY